MIAVIVYCWLSSIFLLLCLGPVRNFIKKHIYTLTLLLCSNSVCFINSTNICFSVIIAQGSLLQVLAVVCTSKRLIRYYTLAYPYFPFEFFYAPIPSTETSWVTE